MLIKSVKMSGYRTIKKLDVSFIPGLNIIIGDNGSGKTNFIKLLNSTLVAKFDRSFIQFSCEVALDEDFILTAINTPSADLDKVADDTESIKVQLHSKSTDKTVDLQKVGDAWSMVRELGNKTYYVRNVPHGFPGKALFLNMPFSGSIDIDENEVVFVQLMELFDENPTNAYQGAFSRFLKLGLASFGFSDIEAKWKIFLDKTCEYFKNYFKKCSPIEDVRIAESFNVDVTGNRVTITNLFFEFFQNGRWNNYQELSDGTKRIVTILMNLVDYKEFVERQSGLDLKSKQEDVIIFIEEPELGIHPHQLYKLMLILKEEAKDKQIIITTHSPQALDILGRDELDCIIISSFDSVKGTQLKHLTDKEREKAIGYLDNVGYLSLYWLHSDLESALK